MQYGEQKIDGKWYLFERLSGAMLTGFQNLSAYGLNKTVYYNAQGQMLYGQQQINGKWYLFETGSGAMQTGFQDLSKYGQKKTVYYNSNGQMLYGQQQINGKWYLFETGSGAMQTGFQDLTKYGQDKTVYYNSDGQMLYNLQQIGGVSYYFNPSSGASTLTVDVSSYQSWMTQNDYKVLKQRGVRSVIVKVSEGTYYTNPYAAQQIQYAQAAGLKVAVYHFADLSGANTQAKANSMATAEANYFVNALRNLGVSKSVPVILDAEASGVNTSLVDWTTVSQKWADTAKASGYNNTRFYCSISWANQGSNSFMEPGKLGAGNIWIAQYPSGSQVNSVLNTDFGAWQYTSTGRIPGLSSSSNVLDLSFDYNFILG